MDSSIGNMETPGKMQRKNHWLRGHHLDKLQTQIICVAPVCLTLTLSLSLSGTLPLSFLTCLLLFIDLFHHILFSPFLHSLTGVFPPFLFSPASHTTFLSFSF